jgi:hypothetical protein
VIFSVGQFKRAAAGQFFPGAEADGDIDHPLAAVGLAQYLESRQIVCGIIVAQVMIVGTH